MSIIKSCCCCNQGPAAIIMLGYSQDWGCSYQERCEANFNNEFFHGIFPPYPTVESWCEQLESQGYGSLCGSYKYCGPGEPNDDGEYPADSHCDCFPHRPDNCLKPYLGYNVCKEWYENPCSPWCLIDEDIIHPKVNAAAHEINNEFVDGDGRVRAGLEVRVKPTGLCEYRLMCGYYYGCSPFNEDPDEPGHDYTIPLEGDELLGNCQDFGPPDCHELPIEVIETPYAKEGCEWWQGGQINNQGEDPWPTEWRRPGGQHLGDCEHPCGSSSPVHFLLPEYRQTAQEIVDLIVERFGPQILSSGKMNPLPHQVLFNIGDNVLGKYFNWGYSESVTLQEGWQKIVAAVWEIFVSEWGEEVALKKFLPCSHIDQEKTIINELSVGSSCKCPDEQWGYSSWWHYYHSGSDQCDPERPGLLVEREHAQAWSYTLKQTDFDHHAHAHHFHWATSACYGWQSRILDSTHWGEGCVEQDLDCSQFCHNPPTDMGACCMCVVPVPDDDPPPPDIDCYAPEWGDPPCEVNEEGQLSTCIHTTRENCNPLFIFENGVPEIGVPAGVRACFHGEGTICGPHDWDQDDDGDQDVYCPCAYPPCGGEGIGIGHGRHCYDGLTGEGLPPEGAICCNCSNHPLEGGAYAGYQNSYEYGGLVDHTEPTRQFFYAGYGYGHTYFTEALDGSVCGEENLHELLNINCFWAPPAREWYSTCDDYSDPWDPPCQMINGIPWLYQCQQFLQPWHLAISMPREGGNQQIINRGASYWGPGSHGGHGSCGRDYKCFPGGGWGGIDEVEHHRGDWLSNLIMVAEMYWTQTSGNSFCSLEKINECGGFGERAEYTRPWAPCPNAVVLPWLDPFDPNLLYTLQGWDGGVPWGSLDGWFVQDSYNTWVNEYLPCSGAPVREWWRDRINWRTDWDTDEQGPVPATWPCSTNSMLSIIPNHIVFYDGEHTGASRCDGDITQPCTGQSHRDYFSYWTADGSSSVGNLYPCGWDNDPTCATTNCNTWDCGEYEHEDCGCCPDIDCTSCEPPCVEHHCYGDPPSCVDGSYHSYDPESETWYYNPWCTCPCEGGPGNWPCNCT